MTLRYWTCTTHKDCFIFYCFLFLLNVFVNSWLVVICTWGKSWTVEEILSGSSKVVVQGHRGPGLYPTVIVLQESCPWRGVFAEVTRRTGSKNVPSVLVGPQPRLSPVSTGLRMVSQHWAGGKQNAAHPFTDLLQPLRHSAPYFLPRFISCSFHPGNSLWGSLTTLTGKWKQNSSFRET